MIYCTFCGMSYQVFQLEVNITEVCVTFLENHHLLVHNDLLHYFSIAHHLMDWHYIIHYNLLYFSLTVYHMFHLDFDVILVNMTFFNVHHFVVHDNLLHLFWMFQYLINLDLVIHHDLLYFYWTYCYESNQDFCVNQVCMALF